MATNIDGKAFAAKIRSQVKEDADKLIANKQVDPCLAVVLVGENPASKVYVGAKTKMAAECNIKTKDYKLDEDTDQETLLKLIKMLNEDTDIHGILVQLPLPKQIDERSVIDAIAVEKDVDLTGIYDRMTQDIFFELPLDFFEPTSKNDEYLIDFQIHGIKALVEANINLDELTREQIESNIVRCGDGDTAEKMIELIKEARSEGNSLGGIVECIIKGVPVGLGDPVFDKLEADLAKAMMSLPATKGFEIGSGFKGIEMTGKEHNDEFYMDGERVRTKTNRSGGIQGGISNGENIIFRVAFKPTATIMTEQQTVSQSGEDTQLKGRGRHDPCVLPRAVPMVDAMVALVLADHLLLNQAQCGLINN